MCKRSEWSQFTLPELLSMLTLFRGRVRDQITWEIAEKCVKEE